MNGEQKGGVKNHFQTLFRILKKLFKQKEQQEEIDKTEQAKKLTREKKQEQAVAYKVYQKNITPNISRKGKNHSILVKDSANKKMINRQIINKRITEGSNLSGQKKTQPVKKLKVNNSFFAEKNKIDVFNNNIKTSVETINKKFKKGKKRIDQKSLKKVNDIKKDNHRENSIVERVNKIIHDNKYDLDKLQVELYEIDQMAYSTQDKDEIKKLQMRFSQIISRIEKIKRDFEVIKDNLYFEDYKELNNYFLLEEIDNFKFSSDLESIELLSLRCKQQIRILNDISTVYEYSLKTAKKLEKQQEKIDYIDVNTQEFVDQTDSLNIVSRKIDNNLALQNKFIADMNKKIGSAHKDVKVYYKYRGLDDLLNSTLSMGLGMYSFSSMRKKPRFKGLKFLVGSFLMYNSIRGMLRFLSSERKKITYIYYEDYAKELDQESYHLTVTHNLLNHSLRDISLLKEDFKNKFMVYQYQIPTYDIMLEKIEKIEKQLKLQKAEVLAIDKTLTDQKQKNNEYVKKIEKYED